METSLWRSFSKKEEKRPGQKHGQRRIPERSKGMEVGVSSAREDLFCGGDKSRVALGGC